MKQLSDEQIMAELGQRLEQRRRHLRLQNKELLAKGGGKKDALASLKRGENISLLNFIKLLRGVEGLEGLEAILKPEDNFSPLEQLRATKRNRPPVRGGKK